MNKLLLAIVFGLIAFGVYKLSISYDDIVESVVKTLIDINFEQYPTIDLLTEYDFIVVGAGTAGCALANRLSENSKWNVLLIEAGDNENVIMDVPIFPHYLQTSKKLNWMYETEPSNQSCLAMDNGRCHWPRGKVMGGSSVLNYMIYTRGNREDFNTWSKMGAKGWSFPEIAKYFKKLENYQLDEFVQETNDLFGQNGPLSITPNNHKSEQGKAMFNALKEMGMHENDYNGRTQNGVSYIKSTRKNGSRHSSNRAYLDPIIKQRKNLHIQKLSLVTKVVIDQHTKIATGIEFLHEQKKYIVKVKKEIVLSAGAINSPQLLMLSGIGPEKHLKEMRIPVIVNLPVGYNLIDHVVPGYFLFTTNTTSLKEQVERPSSLVDYIKSGTGPFTVSGGCETISFFNSKEFTNHNAHPDLEMFIVTGAVYDKPDIRINLRLKKGIFDKVYKELQRDKIKAFTVGAFALRPESRGYLKLKSTHPEQHPLIFPNYYSAQYDMDIGIAGIRKILELENTEAFKRINATLFNPPLDECLHYEFNSDMYWNCYSRHFTYTLYHYLGTCKMGTETDPTAVVDPELRVIGIKNLRVADGSIMPTMISGHPNAAIYMIAEKAADMIKNSWK